MHRDKQASLLHNSALCRLKFNFQKKEILSSLWGRLHCTQVCNIHYPTDFHLRNTLSLIAFRKITYVTFFLSRSFLYQFTWSSKKLVSPIFPFQKDPQAQISHRQSQFCRKKSIISTKQWHVYHSFSHTFSNTGINKHTTKPVNSNHSYSTTLQRNIF